MTIGAFILGLLVGAATAFVAFLWWVWRDD